MSGHAIAVTGLEEPLLMNVHYDPSLLSGHFRHRDPSGPVPSRQVPMYALPLSLIRDILQGDDRSVNWTDETEFFNPSAIILLTIGVYLTLACFVQMPFWIPAGLKSSTTLLVLLIDLLAVDLLFGWFLWMFAQVLIPLLQPDIDTTEFLKRYRSPQITISWDITLLNMVVLRTILTRIKHFLSSDLSLSEFYARGEEL
ncbi:hypothetical protein [Methanosphaerula subterraneus]|uniref:hypothetical protein n=1 Tax=Methanosphaerula subterraneus TaxID=3350244 RepID=UPI003F866FD1